MAQLLLTYGARFVSAVESGILSSSRIIIAVILGPLIAYEAPMSTRGIIGALMVFGANVFLAYKKSTHSGSASLTPIDDVDSPGDLKVK